VEEEPSAKHAASAGGSHAIKAAVDILGGTLLALLATPVIVAGAIGSAVAFRTWPFFVQRRIGHRGREFRCVKIRTLPKRTPPTLDKYSLDGVAIPRLARLLRSTHLDELPQLWQVPVLRMSLVGPRPELPEIEARYPEWLRSMRRTVRPGCTGLWQISVGAPGMIYEAPEYDECYITHRSLRLDAWILWRTARMAAGGRAITLDDLAARGWLVPSSHDPEPCLATSARALR